MIRYSATLALCLVAMIPSGARALPLNTGYNHTNSTVYTPGVADNYWIKIASYEPNAAAVPVAPARVLVGTPASPAWALMPGAMWIGPRPASSSTFPTGPANPAYSIYRKCFCLLHGFANPRLSFRLRSDDAVQVWLNTLTTTLVGPAAANHNSTQMPEYRAETTNIEHFRPGRNCIYVLVEDYYGGHVGFILQGSMNAAGLMPDPAFGTGASFGACGCPGDNPAPANARQDVETSLQEDALVHAIIRDAEGRRMQALAPPPEERALAALSGARN